MLLIDGSLGEGGGQILRSALALSVITRTPFRIERIRANRNPPGLKKQHQTAIAAAAKISGARVRGNESGSSEVRFEPGEVVAGDYRFNVGTAGSTTLVLQTVLPPLMLAEGSSRVRCEGGTHNPHAPPVEFLQKAFLPQLRHMGVHVDLELERYGFYPKGGGAIEARIEPTRKLSRLDLPETDAVRSCRAEVLLVRLPVHIAEREIAALRERFGWPAEAFAVKTSDTSLGPGNVVGIEIVREHVTEWVSAVGERGVHAEKVAACAAEEAMLYLAHDVPVGPHLADQLLLPMALAGRGSFVTGPLTLHAETNIDVLRRFLDVKISATAIGPARFRVKVGGA
jgi:RNA 3'-terminal phosphate cyclase (ATP)